MTSTGTRRWSVSASTSSRRPRLRSTTTSVTEMPSRASALATLPQGHSQFVGVPQGTTAGRELFVYLNRTGRIGQAAVRILRASLRAGHRAVSVRWVDSTTRRVGPYLAGGILIPLHPLAPRTRYRASVTVRDGARTLTHAWRFTTR